MKKVSAIIVCCLLVMALIAMPVLAAQTATFTVKASKTTVNPGDTITVKISTTKFTNCTNIGVSLMFDEAMFEVVADSAKQNTTASMGGGDQKTGKINFFAQTLPAPFGAPFTAEGDIFEVQLKVKDTAAGSSTLSMQAAQAKDTEAATVTATSTVTIKVDCKHTFGAWTPDGANHKQICTKCGEPKTEAHTFGSWSTTTPAGCDKAGEKTRTCTVCNHPETAVINPTGQHKFEGTWTKVDGTNHKRTCSTCTDGTPEVQTKAHTWGAWTETLKPDCKNPGEEKRTCTDNCGAFETRPVPSTGKHNYNTWTKVDDEKHTAVCSGCGEFPKEEAHTWGTATVTTPAGCDKAGEQTQTCTAPGCGAIKKTVLQPTGEHVFGNWTPDGDVNHKRTCTTCTDGTPEVQTEAHKAGTELKTDAENHWSECVCGQKMGVTAHVYDHMVGDAEGHAEGCVCGVLKSGATKAPHTFDEGVVTLKPTNKKEGEKTFTCTACQFKKIEKIDKVTTPNTGDNTLVIPMVILAVLSACGLAVTVVARKRASR